MATHPSLARVYTWSPNSLDIDSHCLGVSLNISERYVHLIGDLVPPSWSSVGNRMFCVFCTDHLLVQPDVK